jgi:hypothetical protein
LAFSYCAVTPSMEKVKMIGARMHGIFTAALQANHGTNRKEIRPTTRAAAQPYSNSARSPYMKEKITKGSAQNSGRFTAFDRTAEYRSAFSYLISSVNSSLSVSICVHLWLNGFLYVDWLELAHHVSAAALVAGAWAVASGIEVHADPTFVRHGFQHAMAGREIDIPVT